MKRNAFIVLATGLFLTGAGNAFADNSKTTYTYTIERCADEKEPSLCPVYTGPLSGLLQVENVNSALANGKVKFYGIQGSSGKYYGSSTLSTYGHYFNANGIVVPATNTKRVWSSQYNTVNAFTLNYVGDVALTKDYYSLGQAFVNTTTNDTVEFRFNITIGTRHTVSTDQPKFVHRKDMTESWLALPFVQKNEQGGLTQNFIQVNAGDNVTFGLRPRNEGDVVKFSVKNPAGKSVRSTQEADFLLSSIEPADAGAYTITAQVTPAGGTRKVQTYTFYLDVQTKQGENFDWDKETPYWSYDFRDEYPDGFPQPTKTFTFKQHNGKDAYAMHGEWWSVFWGDNLNTEVWDGKSGETVDGDRKHAMTNILKKFDEDYAYIRDEMGWPPDLAARSGYKSFIYVFGSGINNDNTSNTEQGGYQGYTRPANASRSYACVYASYYPMSRFRDDADSKWSDGDYQREAMIHEGIHAIFADYPGCKKSAWFQEAGNVWLQGAMNAKRGLGAQVSGWLGVGNLICPFMPIECYSGWLQDGSFGGPAAEGVNMYNGSQQVCTWRNLIGGVQYGETFPIFLGLNVGYGSVPWIWRYCNDYVLKGIAEGKPSEGIEGIGDEGMRKLILHYRAKLATMDFKESSNGMRSLLDGSFGTVVKPEWEPYWIDCEPFTLTPYQTLTQNDDEGWMAPDTITNPGWSGGNIIPIHVDGNGCEVTFRPEDSQMRAQLCYRTKDGRCFYSQPVLCGEMVLNWDESNAPANGVVFIVVCNTDYIYTGDAQRKHHWDYRIKFGDGVLGTASIRKRWYFYERDIVDEDFVTGIKVTKNDVKEATNSSELPFLLMSTVLRSGAQVKVDLCGAPAKDVTAHLIGASGIMIESQKVLDGGYIQLPANLPRGMYFLSLEYEGRIKTFKTFCR